MMKIFFSFLFVSFNTFSYAELIPKKIICSSEAYNCPSYKGKYQYKRLRSCKEVQLVWKACGKEDPHDLDRDSDGWPCERDCPASLFL